MKRYIDRDVLADYACRHYGGLTASEIMRFPTADVEPVKHGRWIRGENKGFPEKPSMIWYCSVCGERIRYNDTLRKYQKIKKSVSQINPRCRNCGARMDGDSDAI